MKEGFEVERCEVVVANTGDDAFFRINTEQFDVILLDILLPRRDGLQILEAIRKVGVQTPVILLAVRDAVDNRVALERWRR